MFEGGEPDQTIDIVAPESFTEEAVRENVLAGSHMARRAGFMFGTLLERSDEANIGVGLGPGLANGTVGVLPPTKELEGESTDLTIDGIRFEFVDAAATEASSEFIFFLPDFNILCTAEVASPTFHNALPHRGAKARDRLPRSESIDGMLQRFGDRTGIAIASYHWPSWGNENVRRYLTNQHDMYHMYLFAHDRTLREANRGVGIDEVADAIACPDVIVPRYGIGAKDLRATVTLDRADFDRLILKESGALVMNARFLDLWIDWCCDSFLWIARRFTA